MVGEEVTDDVGEVVEGVEVWGQYPTVCGIRVLAATQVCQWCCMCMCMCMCMWWAFAIQAHAGQWLTATLLEGSPVLLALNTQDEVRTLVVSRHNPQSVASWLELELGWRGSARRQSQN